MSTPESCFDEQENKAQPKPDAQTGSKGLPTVMPHHQHENPLRQHPVWQMHLPIRLRIPQRHSSLKFGQNSSHNSLRISTLPSTEVSSSEPNNTSNLQLELPRQTTTTGLHLNYRQISTTGSQMGQFQQIATAGLDFDNPQDAITRPQPAVLAPRDAPGLGSVSHRPQIAKELRVEYQELNDRILAHFDPQMQNTGVRFKRKMQNHNDHDMARDTVAKDFQPQTHASGPTQAATMLQRQASQMSQVRQLFGREGRSRKRSRSETPATMESLPPTKRVRGAITSARHRLSRVMTPAEDTGAEGRQSRLDKLTEAAKRMSLVTPPQMIQVVDFAPGVSKEIVKVALLGNSGVGKTKLVQAFRTGSYEEEDEAPTLHQIADGYKVDSINVVLDGVPVALQTWDVSSQCDVAESYGNSVRPLQANFYDVLVLCYDVSDESTLKAVESKWAHDAERYCTGAPTILLGLKIDLRMPFPSLRLAHLKEPKQTSTGQGEAAGKKMVVEAFYEVSAKTGEGVSDFFESVARFALQRRTRQSHGPLSRVKRVFKDLKRGMKKDKV
ncbi:hypothetical protein N0V82_001101 [Gnomoniopsis sp. IMI 355080]|nr:hypothetical protein N0V82_001101 [Gnomoniopsis sp. IMI 355080]